MNAVPGQPNVRTMDLVKRADGSPITAGTVNYYVQATTGANAGKWFRESDDSWQAAETVCAAMTHVGSAAQWEITVSAACWIDGVEYREYAMESGALGISYSQAFRCDSAAPTAAQIAAAVVGDAAFKRLLAFAGEYRRVTSIVYSGTEVASATIKIYASKADMGTDTPSATVLYTATIVAGQVTAHEMEKTT